MTWSAAWKSKWCKQEPARTKAEQSQMQRRWLQVLMVTSNENQSEMDCLLMQHMVQASASKQNRETVTSVEIGLEHSMKELQARREEERKQQMDIENWQAQGGKTAEGTCQQKTHETKLCPCGVMYVFGNSKSTVKDRPRAAQKNTT